MGDSIRFKRLCFYNSSLGIHLGESKSINCINQGEDFFTLRGIFLGCHGIINRVVGLIGIGE